MSQALANCLESPTLAKLSGMTTLSQAVKAAAQLAADNELNKQKTQLAEMLSTKKKRKQKPKKQAKKSNGNAAGTSPTDIGDTTENGIAVNA